MASWRRALPQLQAFEEFPCNPQKHPKRKRIYTEKLPDEGNLQPDGI